RNIALEGWQRQLIACTLVLSPTETLRNQLVAQDKWQKWLSLYRVQPPVPPRRVLPTFLPNCTANGEFLVSATTALVQRNVDLFREWIGFLCHTRGRPPLV